MHFAQTLAIPGTQKSQGFCANRTPKGPRQKYKKARLHFSFVHRKWGEIHAPWVPPCGFRSHFKEFQGFCRISAKSDFSQPGGNHPHPGATPPIGPRVGGFSPPNPGRWKSRCFQRGAELAILTLAGGNLRVSSQGMPSWTETGGRFSRRLENTMYGVQVPNDNDK